MKCVLLAGGLGTRLSEETVLKPKPMVEIGGKPIIWHIMKIYASHGINDFIICLGYKGYVIKEYFSNYFLHNADVTVDLVRNDRVYHHSTCEPWRITFVDTGLETMTGGRLRRVAPYLDPNEDFCFTYGDGVGNVDIGSLVKFHKAQGTIGTVTAVQPPGRFGSLVIDEDRVNHFEEKPAGDGAWINGGFFVLSRKAIDYIDGDSSIWERKPLENLAKNGQLSVHKHHGFWQPMDTMRDKLYLEDLWESNKAPWKVWQ